MSGMRLLPECYLVASGYLGFNLSSHWDGHAYLVVSGNEAMLIDSGCGREVDALIERIEVTLGRTSRLIGVALTHSHVDHSGGAAALSEHFGVPVHVHPIARDWLRRGDETAVGLDAARATGVYPPDQVLRPVQHLQVAADDIPFGRTSLRVHATPGHSADHLVYSLRLPSGLAMFTGDLVFAQGRVAILDTPDTDRTQYEASVRQMHALRPDHLLPGHGAVSLTRGWAHIEAAVTAFDNGEEPAGLIS